MKQDKICGIYKITSPTNRIYIGQSNDCMNRISTYRNIKCQKQRKLFYSLLKHGWEAHTFEIIIQCRAVELNFYESYFIELYQTFNTEIGLNLTNGGKSSGRMSEESKDKNRKSQLGKKHTTETKLKLSLYHSGRPKTIEHRLNLSKSKIGKKHSEEAKKKISDSHKGEKCYWFGKNLSDDAKLKNSIAHMGEKSFCFGKFGSDHPSFGLGGKLTLNIETGIYYTTMKDACKSINMKWETFRKKISGRLKNTTPFIYV